MKILMKILILMRVLKKIMIPDDIDSDGYDPIKATDFDDELASDHTNEKKRNEENAALNK